MRRLRSRDSMTGAELSEMEMLSLSCVLMEAVEAGESIEVACA